MKKVHENWFDRMRYYEASRLNSCTSQQQLLNSIDLTVIERTMCRPPKQDLIRGILCRQLSAKRLYNGKTSLQTA
ncbi:hypothetical protein DOY81_007228 [Sarcophaga bullata]|nr:hypothetical protein DOY81_007228 [Sarcophaga bullata]